VLLQVVVMDIVSIMVTIIMVTIIIKITKIGAMIETKTTMIKTGITRTEIEIKMVVVIMTEIDQVGNDQNDSAIKQSNNQPHAYYLIGRCTFIYLTLNK
jgi:hypothetical protein